MEEKSYEKKRYKTKAGDSAAFTSGAGTLLCAFKWKHEDC